MDERTERIAQAVRAHGAELVSVKPLHGGACQENHRVELTLEGAPLTLALRSDAATSLPGSLRRRDEFAVLQAAVAAQVTTPRARWLTHDLLRPGADAYFLDWCAGEAIGRRVVRNPELALARRSLASELAKTLARVHRITPATSSLPLTVPSSPARASLEALATMLATIPKHQPGLEFALTWLRERAPADEPVVLVHGDFRTGNFLVAPEGLTAVLDWEFAHFGSPAEDLAWISVRDWRFNQLALPIGGFSAREPFYDAWEAASGLKVNLEHLLWWEVFGNLRWAVGSLFQGERYLSGEQSDLELIAIARRSTEMEFEALRLIRRGAL